MLRILWVGSPMFTAGHPAPLIALVHHRMVGTLRSTDAAFSSSAGREASTNFGIGLGCGKTGHPVGAHVHQYVRLGDQAWGNGNWDASGEWNDRYPVANLNSRTISIEHHDNGGRKPGSGKGVVPPAVIEASIELDRLLLRGDITELRDAGARFRGGTEADITRELRRIPLDRHHLIDHHYIAGRLKPSCWRPWADDPTGFPQARYLEELAAPLKPPTTGDAVKSFLVPEARTLAMVENLAWLYVDSSLAPDPSNVQVSPAREFVLVGVFSAGVSIVAYEPRAGDVDTASRAMFIATTDIASRRPAPPPVDSSPFTQADLDKAKAAGYAAAKAKASAAVAAI